MALGALLGAALGHKLEQKAADGIREGAGFDIGSQPRVQAFFYGLLFGDGACRQGRRESQLTRDRDCPFRDGAAGGLAPELQRKALRLFTEGKRADFPLDEVLTQFKRE